MVRLEKSEKNDHWWYIWDGEKLLAYIFKYDGGKICVSIYRDKVDRVEIS